MDRKLVCVVAAALALQIIGAARVMCPNDPNCVCGGTLAVELNCNIDGRTVKISLLPNTYIDIKCENATSLDYNKLPKCANHTNSFKSVSFKDCPLPSSSFKDVLMNMGVSKTMALIFQNAKNLSGYFDRKHFAGLQDLTKLLLSIKGVTHLPNNLFVDINKLTWLNIRSNSINLSEELFKPLEKLETLEISHNHMTNISSNLFSHLSYLRKLSLWQSNVTWFSKDLFTGIDVLEELDLSSNGLNELPSSIFKPLRKLKKLTLFSNKFSSLPQNLFKHNEELETVVILNNDAKLKELPKYLFGGLNNLKEIYIQRSGLEILPYDVFANSPQITNISLPYNEIKTLPESVFNDQINLLELDLSHNRLNSLEPKIFSSLVRLETLRLDHNRLVKISGSTFSSLLSLIYLNMESNNLKTISSYMFSNNKQRMTISLAYNYLSFEEEVIVNNKFEVKRVSPFAHTYNLKLLNLTHNKFKMGFEDWWKNGHDILDIRYNCIKLLWPHDVLNQTSLTPIIKKPIKAWITENPLKCECNNFIFMDFHMHYIMSNLVDIKNINCPLWTVEACYWRFKIIGLIVAVMLCLYVISAIVMVVFRKQINNYMKNKMHKISKNDKKLSLTLIYDVEDEEFVLAEFLPGLREYHTLKCKNTITIQNNKDSLQIDQKSKHINLIIFSPTYLMSTYGHVDIKKILSKMLRKRNTIYVFLDVDPDNSIYAFLKEHRDRKNCIVWNEPTFWDKFSKMIDVEKLVRLIGSFEEYMHVQNMHGEDVAEKDLAISLESGTNIYYKPKQNYKKVEFPPLY